LKISSRNILITHQMIEIIEDHVKMIGNKDNHVRGENKSKIKIKTNTKIKIKIKIKRNMILKRIHSKINQPSTQSTRKVNSLDH
jgi:hypothetical protein